MAFLVYWTEWRKALKKFKSMITSLYSMTIGVMIIMLIVFALMVELIGYYAFTSAFTREYSNYVSSIANYSLKLVVIHDFEKLMKYEQDDLDNSYDQYMGGFISEDDREIASLSMGYGFTRDNLNEICNSTGMSVVYIIKPDEDFLHYTSIINCPNENLGYTPWEIGHREETPADYIEAYRNIYEGGSESELVFRYENLGSGKPHITALVPVKNSKNEIVGILCVQRFVDELINTRRNFVQGITGLAFIIIIFIVLLVSVFLRKNVLKPIDSISKEAERFAKDSKGVALPTCGTIGDEKYHVNEIKSLAESIDNMEIDTIKSIEHITMMTREKERVDSDISLASKIQMGMLPQKDQLLEEYDEFDISASMRPAKSVGGDFYDYFMIDDRHLAILVADVSDKGIGAAFFMAISKTLIKARARMGGSAPEIIEYVDDLIEEKNPMGMFVTVWFGIVDITTGHVNVCNAGHDYPAIMQNGEDYKIEKTPHGCAIGFLPGLKQVGYEMDLNPGDRIFLYTDGVNEAKRPDGERFGIDRMLEVLNENKETDNDTLISRMKKAVDSFAGEEPQFDDMTMLSFTYIGKRLKIKVEKS